MLDPIRKKFETDVQLQKLREDAYPEGESKSKLIAAYYYVFGCAFIRICLMLTYYIANDSILNMPLLSSFIPKNLYHNLTGMHMIKSIASYQNSQLN